MNVSINHCNLFSSKLLTSLKVSILYDHLYCLTSVLIFKLSQSEIFLFFKSSLGKRLSAS